MDKGGFSMRFLRSLTLVLFVLVCAASVYFNLKVKPDTNGPVISCAENEIKASCRVTEDELLEYVTASDKKDGDLSDDIFVESVSPFIEEGVSNVIFCVGDSDGNIAKKVVRLVYADYEKPTLRLKDDLVFEKSAAVDLSGAAAVSDMFDGDISDRLYMILSDENEGEKSVLFKVTNSKGFTYEWKFGVVRVEDGLLNDYYKIKLSENYISLEPGSKTPDFKSYVEKITAGTKNFKSGTLDVDASELDLTKEGEYSVWFRLYSGKKKKKSALLTVERLIVVCEERDI